MKRWHSAIVSFGGLGLAILVYFAVDPTSAAVVAVVTICAIGLGDDFVGNTPLPEGAGDVDPVEVRQYRERHPGTSITAAIAATHRLEQES